MLLVSLQYNSTCTSAETFSGALEAFIGSSRWQFSVIAGSDVEVYQFSRITFLDKFPIQHLEMWNIVCLEDHVLLQNQFQSALRCSLKSGWAPTDIHSLIQCDVLSDNRNAVALKAVKGLLKDRIVHLISRRRKSQTTCS
jgi:hypothetical protein